MLHGVGIVFNQSCCAGCCRQNKDGRIEKRIEMQTIMKCDDQSTHEFRSGIHHWSLRSSFDPIL